MNHLRFHTASRRWYPNPRAMAVKFQLSDGKSVDILSLSVEGFPARTPEEFLAFLLAQQPDPATGNLRPMRFLAFLRAIRLHAASLSVLMQKRVPENYGQASYFGEQAFLFSAA
jgi:catalase